MMSVLVPPFACGDGSEWWLVYRGLCALIVQDGAVQKDAIGASPA